VPDYNAVVEVIPLGDRREEVGATSKAATP
jgi:hypothetical protein